MFADQGMSHRLILNASIPGSDVEYYGINYAYKQYFNIPFPIINRLTMMVKADLAFNDAYGDSIGVPPYKNFYAGGPDTVRGDSKSIDWDQKTIMGTLMAVTS